MAAVPRFLIIATNPKRKQPLETLLSGVEGVLNHAASVSKALDPATQAGISAIFLDADDPKLSAALLCRRLRKRLPVTSCAIILFGSKLPGEELARLLDSGADDYWAFPLREPVCLAYLRAILRRVTRLQPPGKPLELGRLKVDPVRRRAFLGGAAIPLRSKEFDLLYCLLQHKGEALSRDFLLQTVWGYEYFGTTRTIDFHVSQLRRKLGRLGRRIETVAGSGYRLAER